MANKRYYNKQKEQKVYECSLATLAVEIPESLVTRAQRTLRPCLALASDDYGPLLWSPGSRRFFHPPTYMLDAMPWPTVRSLGGVWETRAAVLAAYQWRELMEDGRSRMARWTAPVAALHREVTTEVYKRVAGWTALYGSQLDVEEEEQYTREVALDWGAKVVLLLVEEWEFRARNGRGAYEKAAKADQLPWQLFVAQTERLFASECRKR